MTRRVWVVVALVVGLVAGVVLQRQLVTVHCADAAEGYRAAAVELAEAVRDHRELADGAVAGAWRARAEQERCQAGGLS